MTLVLSVMVLLWICCATVATAAEQYVPSEELSIYSDLEFVKELKLNRYPASSLVLLDLKVKITKKQGLLPAKMNLAHSEI